MMGLRRMLPLLVVLAVCYCTTEIAEDEYLAEFNKLTTNLQAEGSLVKLRSNADRTLRYGIFKSRYNEVKTINSGQSQWIAVTNEFTILTDAELKSYTGLNISFRTSDDIGGQTLRSGAVSDAPTSLSWKDKGKVTDIKAQGNCGSCWAFAAVAAVESHYAILTGKLQMMSEQKVLDCTYIDQNHDGCQGGWMSAAFEKIRNKLKNKLPTGNSYQYKGEAADKCKAVKSKQNALVSANIAKSVYTQVQYNKDQSAAPYDSNLADAVSIGPVTVAIEVVSSMYSYGSGVYSEKNCKTLINHAVTVVGYDTSSFTIKNSWGSNWGDSGYIKFDRSIPNQCFIGQYPEYPNMELTGDGGDDKSSEDPCKPNPCQHKGKCTAKAKGSGYTCKCKKKYQGTNCQEKKTKKCADKAKKCPTSKTDKKCKTKFGKKKCQLSCGVCYL